MDKVYLVQFSYENGKKMFLLEPGYIGMQSRADVEAFAKTKMQKLNHEFVAGVVGKIVAFDIFEGKKV